MRVLGLSVVVALWCAPTVASAAGYAQVVFDSKSPAEVSGILAGSCADKGRRVASASPNEVICEGELSAAQSLVAGLLYGNRYSSEPALKFQFTIFPVGNDTRVQFREYIETVTAFGQPRDSDVDNADATFQTLQSLYKLGAHSPNVAPPVP